MKNKFIIFLIGGLFGQLTLVYPIYELVTKPAIRAEVVPNCYELVQQPFDRQIENITDYTGRTNTLTIHLIKWSDLQDLYHERYGDGGETVMGFYDDKTNEIFCVYDALVLIHELTHVFNGNFHG